MFSADDTIVAIATPAGRGALGVIRISGPMAAAVAREILGRRRPLAPRHATLVRVRSAGTSDAVRDQAIATFFPRPFSYTGDDLVELSLHGGPAILQGVLEAAVAQGARLAQPGEFTLRAFLNGKLDLVQAEAVADLIEAVTPLQARAAFDQLDGTLTTTIAALESELFDLMARLEASLDFPEEGYRFVEPAAVASEIAGVRRGIDALFGQAARGRLLREGATVALAGAPNVGKSSLFNALLNANRAIVTAIPGTTRDLLSERLEVAGTVLRLVDTAGLRDSDDEVEREGVERTRGALRVADLVLVVVDGSQAMSAADRELIDACGSSRALIVVNKIDLPRLWHRDGGEPRAIEVSARTGEGLPQLAEAMARALTGGEPLTDVPVITNVRHVDLLRRASASLGRAEDAMTVSTSPIPEEFVLSDLQESAALLQEIVGRRTTDDLLHHIFARFCIGK